MRSFALAALAGTAAADTFRVEFTSSTPKDTSSPVKVQLGSTLGDSPFIELGQAFLQGVTKTEYLNVNELSTLPNKLTIQADNWNGLNFVTVGDGNAKVAQFRTDFFTSSGAPHSAKAGDSEAYFYDMQYTSASGADVLAAPRAYKISWQTGYHANSGSKSPQYVQLQGDKGKSRYYLVDDIFAPGHVGERNLAVWEDIGELQAIELLAGGPDSWNPINMVEVLTPSNENIQFPANLMLDLLPTDKEDTVAYGVYPHKNKATLSAVNVEGTAVTPKTYQLSYETGTHQNSASSSPMFAQLIGDGGASNFVKLGDDFSRGKREVVDVTVAHSFGLLKSVKFQAGGTDGWNVVGDFTVRTPAQVEVHFQTDFFLDEAPHDASAMYGQYHYYQSKTVSAAHPEPPKPCNTRGQLNCCGNGICDATEDVGNCGRDCIHSGLDSYAWGMRETNSTVAPTFATAAPDAFLGDEGQETDSNHRISHSNNAKQVATRAKGEWSAQSVSEACSGLTQRECDAARAKEVGYLHNGQQTTQHVTAKGESCTVGSKTVKDGWTMEGTGANYCNYCKCNDGAISCTKRPCGLPFGGNIPTGYSKCNHVECKFAPEEAKFPWETVRVTHKEKHLAQGVFSDEQGNHSCAYNKYSKKCTCYCKAKKTNYIEREVGKHAFGTGGFVGKHCEAVTFGGLHPQQFDPAKGAVTTIVTVSHTHRTKPVHDAPMIWVEESTEHGFTVCGREDKKFWNTYDRHDHRLVIDYYSYQAGPNMPFAGARAAATAVPSNANGGVHCKTIPFCSGTDVNCRPFDRAPTIVGSIDHQNADLAANMHQATSHWIEDVNGDQFRVCFRESAHHDDGHEQFFFNWMAVQHRNPMTWYKNHAAYSTAGSVRSNGLWAKPTDFVRTEAEEVGLLACKWIEFQGVTFDATPTVLLTARHVATGAIDWDSTPIHPATITYVNKVSALGFEACSTTMEVEGVSSKDDALVWSYVAFGAHVADTKVVTTTHITGAIGNEQAASYNPPKHQLNVALSSHNGSPEGARDVVQDNNWATTADAQAKFDALMGTAVPSNAKHTGGDQGQTEGNGEPRDWERESA